MTDLQIGLLFIGAAAVAGVLVYNRLQERGTRRKAEEAFGSKHADVLMGAAGGAPRADSGSGSRDSDTGASVTAPGHQARAAGARPARRLCARAAGHLGWRPAAGVDNAPAPLPRRAVLSEAGSRKLHAKLQMVNRHGVVSEAEPPGIPLPGRDHGRDARRVGVGPADA